MAVLGDLSIPGVVLPAITVLGVRGSHLCLREGGSGLDWLFGLDMVRK